MYTRYSLKFFRATSMFLDQPLEKKVLRCSGNGLLLIAGVTPPSDSERAAITQLGRPYAAATHYEIHRDTEGRETVRFSEAARNILRSLMVPDGGCPARRLPDPKKPRQPLIAKTYLRIIDYLFPHNATVKDI